MYLLYLDDSGSVGNQNESHLILGGFIVEESSLYWINKYLDDLAATINSQDPDTVEFHCCDIFSGRRAPWTEVKAKENRKEIIKSILTVTHNSKNNMALLACAVKKTDFPQYDPVEMAFEELCSRFSRFLNRKHHETGARTSGLIILDESTHETSLQQLSRKFRREGTRWCEANNIQEVPLFVDSRASRAIQLADAIAYAVFRRYSQADLNYFNVIQNHFDSTEGQLHGLVHKTVDKNCTCPHCLLKSYKNRNRIQESPGIE